MLLPTMDKNPRIEPSFHELGAAMHANTDGHVFLSFVVIRDGYLEKGFCDLLLCLWNILLLSHDLDFYMECPVTKHIAL